MHAGEHSNRGHAFSAVARTPSDNRDIGFRSLQGEGSPRKQAFRSAYTNDQSLPRDVDSSEGGREGEVRSLSRCEDGSGPRCEVRRGDGHCDVKSLYQIASECYQPLDLK